MEGGAHVREDSSDRQEIRRALEWTPRCQAQDNNLLPTIHRGC
jgi:hypothetical protein